MRQATVLHQVCIVDGSRVLDDDSVVIQHGTLTAVGSDLTFP